MVLSSRNGAATGSPESKGRIEQERPGGTATETIGHERDRLARFLSNGLLPLPIGRGTGSAGSCDSGIGAGLEADEKVAVASLVQDVFPPREPRYARLQLPSICDTVPLRGGSRC